MIEGASAHLLATQLSSFQIFSKAEATAHEGTRMRGHERRHIFTAEISKQMPRDNPDECPAAAAGTNFAPQLIDKLGALSKRLVQGRTLVGVRSRRC